MSKKIRIGPRDHGRRMTLGDFEFVGVEESHLFELARGYIVALDLPIFEHSRQIGVIRQHLSMVQRVPAPLIVGSMDCKLLIPETESERHPDIAIYLEKPTGKTDRTLWRRWNPDIVFEVVSTGSRDRDYTQKPDDYWTIGVKEYWILDAEYRRVVVFRRGKNTWIEKTLGPDDVCETKLLPGFKLPCQAVFAAAGEAE